MPSTLQASRDSVNPSITKYDVDNSFPKFSPRSLTTDRGTPAQGLVKGQRLLPLCRAVFPPAALLAGLAVEHMAMEG